MKMKMSPRKRSFRDRHRPKMGSSSMGGPKASPSLPTYDSFLLFPRCDWHILACLLGHFSLLTILNSVDCILGILSFFFFFLLISTLISEYIPCIIQDDIF
jgi:hypothetical protein